MLEPEHKQGANRFEAAFSDRARPGRAIPAERFF